MNDTTTANMNGYAYELYIFSEFFKMGIMQSKGNHIFDWGKFWFYMFGGPGSPTDF